MHAGQYAWFMRRQLVDEGCTIVGVGKIIHCRPRLLARFQYIVFGNDRVLCSKLGKQISAKEGAGLAFKQVAAFPTMRQMRRGDPRHIMPPEANGFALTLAGRVSTLC